jgi:ubiquinone/menaquinone biosynthesis C-methylase UbiE
VPEVALDLARGCGNPTGFAQLQLGEVVVDFGCGGGLDVILAAHKVGPHGKVVGLDMAPEMIARARQSVAAAGLQERDIELKVAELEKSQLPDTYANVIISNCVINLCPDKDAVYEEAYRILRPGGRLAISDIVFTEAIDPELRERFRLTWAGCLGGAIPEADYWQTVENAGFTDIQVISRHVLSPEELAAMASCPGKDFTPSPDEEERVQVEGKVASVKFTAHKR